MQITAATESGKVVFWGACMSLIWVFWDLKRAQKRHFGPKHGLMGARVATIRPYIRSKCVVKTSTAQLDHLVVIVTKSCCTSTSRGAIGQIWAKIGAFGSPKSAVKFCEWAKIKAINPTRPECKCFGCQSAMSPKQIFLYFGCFDFKNGLEGDLYQNQKVA